MSQHDVLRQACQWMRHQWLHSLRLAPCWQECGFNEVDWLPLACVKSLRHPVLVPTQIGTPCHGSLQPAAASAKLHFSCCDWQVRRWHPSAEHPAQLPAAVPDHQKHHVVHPWLLLPPLAPSQQTTLGPCQNLPAHPPFHHHCCCCSLVQQGLQPAVPLLLLLLWGQLRRAACVLRLC